MNRKTDDRRVRKTKQALRQCLAQLLQKKSLKDISVRELTDLADLHRGTFYVHYKDIYDLYNQIEEQTLEEVTAILDAYPTVPRPGEPLPVIHALLEYISDNVDLCVMILGENGDTSSVRRLTSIVEEKCMEHWGAAYQNYSLSSSKFFTCYVISGCIGVIRRWIESGMQETPQQLASMLEQMTIEGMAFMEKPTLT